MAQLTATDLAAACITQWKQRQNAPTDDSMDKQHDSEPVAEAEPLLHEMGVEHVGSDTVTEKQE